VSECDCKSCQNACKYRPGWFLPNQVADIEKFFNKPISLLLGEKLSIDWWEEENILILAPQLKNNDDIQYPADPRGECVFFNDNKCDIHKIKPFECAEYLHDENIIKNKERHKFVKDEWKKSNILNKYKEDFIFYEFNNFSGYYL